MTDDKPRRVAVIGGGQNAEHDVSLASAAAVARAVTALGQTAVPLTIDRSGRWHLTDGPDLSPADAVSILDTCDVAFPVLHGVNGEDGAIAGLLTMIGVPAVGSPVRAGAFGVDKWVTKLIAEAAGIPTAPAAIVTHDDRTPPPFPPPFVVKPTTGGSSNGVCVVTTLDDLVHAVGIARADGGTALIEAFVTGREVDIALFRDADGQLRAGATLEIGVAEGDIFGREQKYDGSARFTVPARLSPAENDAIETAARVLYETLGCSGVARFDFFVTADGVVLNEVNTIPGLTEQSQVPRMFAAVGIDYVTLVAELVRAAGATAPAAGTGEARHAHH